MRYLEFEEIQSQSFLLERLPQLVSDTLGSEFCQNNPISNKRTSHKRHLLQPKQVLQGHKERAKQDEYILPNQEESKIDDPIRRRIRKQYNLLQTLLIQELKP